MGLVPTTPQFPPKPKASDIQVLPDPARRWLPASAAQKAALDCPADILLLGGAAGSLKTSTMLVDLIQERDYPTMRSYFFRRTYAELEGGDGAIDQSHHLFSNTGAIYNASSHTWRWPGSGAEFYFRHAQHEKHVYQYQGHAMSALAIDESTHWPEKMVRYLVTRNRSTDPNITVRVRLGTNPGNVGHKWHQKLFMGGVCPHCEPDKAPPQELLRYDGRWPSDDQPLEVTLDNGRKETLSIAYILSSVRDHQMYPASYLARLKMQTAATAKALLEGCWKIFEGQFFDVWEPNRGMRNELTWEHHAKEIMELPPGTGPMVIPRKYIGEQSWWPRWVGSDYGFSISITAAHLAMHMPQSKEWPRGRTFIVDEIGCQEDALSFGKILLKRWVLGDDDLPIQHHRWMPWYLSPDSFREVGTPFTIAGQLNEPLSKYGRSFSKADNDRQGGALKMYTGFEAGELVICAECKQTIEAIESRIHDDKNENDVRKVHGDTLDDFYDSCRYTYKSFETARKVTAPVNVRIAERLEKEFKVDPSTAMFNAAKIQEEEHKKSQPQVYGGSARARMMRNKGRQR